LILSICLFVCAFVDDDDDDDDDDDGDYDDGDYDYDRDQSVFYACHEKP